jgi:hypothetical protein
MTTGVTLPAQGTGDTTPKAATQFDNDAHVQQITPGRLLRSSQNLTVSTTAYTAKDAVGGLITFSSFGRLSLTSGGSIVSRGLITSVVLLDFDQQKVPMELALFDRTFTATTDNAIFAPSDSDLANLIAVIPISQYFDFSTNCVGFSGNLGIPYVCNGADLFGQLLTRGAPTFTSTTAGASLKIILSGQAE